MIAGYRTVDRYLRFCRFQIDRVRAGLVAGRYRIGDGYRRIYHFHVRKTGGTSLNAAFWSLAGFDMQSMGRRTLAVGDGLVLVRHHKRLIERGRYFFANSHLPAHDLRLPGDTFTICVLRDPLERIVSHYRYLLWSRDDPDAYRREPYIESLREEVAWLGSSFGEFVSVMPREHLLRQLFMFSRDFDVGEAANRILACNAVLHTGNLGEDLRQLAEHLRLPLREHNERRFGGKISLTDEESDQARALLAPEYRLLDLIREKRPGSIL